MKFIRNNIILHPKRQWYLNTLRNDNIDYILSHLPNSYNGRSKGGNSNVFTITNDLEQNVIKFSKYDLLKMTEQTEKRILRFSREVEALNACKNNGKNRIIEIKFDGEIEIDGRSFSYYVMEKAHYDLATFLNKEELSFQQRLSLCLEILEGIKQLHSLRIYHRDIKPDNILYTDSGWKIGDLGLVDSRDSDFEIDEIGEKIGPIGWLSPEAANKFLCEGSNRTNRNNHDVILNYDSDVFQLGKLFWYILQGNIPIGQIQKEDFILDDSVLFNILRKTLAHSKSNRYSLEDLQKQFADHSVKYTA